MFLACYLDLRHFQASCFLNSCFLGKKKKRVRQQITDGVFGKYIINFIIKVVLFLSLSRFFLISFPGHTQPPRPRQQLVPILHRRDQKIV